MMVPAHDRYIAASGEGTTWTVAIGRAVDKIFKDKRLHRKRVAFPIKMTLFDANEKAGDE